MAEEKPKRVGTWESVRVVLRSWRTASVALLMFSSSLPLGLVWITIPAWIAYLGADIRVVAWFGAAQAPWSFKFLWAPLIDRYPMPFLGRKRGWILTTQIVMFFCGLGLAAAARSPGSIWTIFVLAFIMALAGATQDIAYDAYAVEVLRPEEHGVASGARIVFGRIAMLLSGGAAITIAVDYLSWATVNLVLALCYLPLMVVTWKAPEPESLPQPPPSLRDAIWEPFVGFLAKHRALEILSFVVLFKLSDNLTQALLRPFFVQMGFGAFDVGLGSMLIGTVAMIIGGTMAGVLTQPLGLGRSLWIFGLLQVFSNLGYAVVAVVPTRTALYAAQFVEMGTSGLGTGAFMVLLLRLTQKRFSATQYALLSSLMAITRVFTGPVVGLLVDALGWRDFFIATLLAGVPGMVLLARFVPWSVREPEFVVAPLTNKEPLTREQLWGRAIFAAILCFAVSVLTLGVLGGARAYSAGKVRAAVRDVTPNGVQILVRVSDAAATGSVKIRDVDAVIPLGEFQGQPLPVPGDRVVVIQERTKEKELRFSRKKVGDRRFDPWPRLQAILVPRTFDDALTTFGVVLFSILSALVVAATLAARRGVVTTASSPAA